MRWTMIIELMDDDSSNWTHEAGPASAAEPPCRGRREWYNDCMGGGGGDGEWVGGRRSAARPANAEPERSGPSYSAL